MPLLQRARQIFQLSPDRLDPQGTQFGAIPYRVVEGHVVFLMITSRRSANWVFPKGSALKGLTPAETAAREAFEEAGVRGEISEEPIGYYIHPRNDRRASLVRIELFPLHVTEQLDHWPEEPERFRHWALLRQLRRLMASRQAARVAGELNRRLLAADQVPSSSRMRA